jgi:hypothetical protein
MQEKSEETLQACPQCKSQHIVNGELVSIGGKSQLLTFRPDSRKNFLSRLLTMLQEATTSPYIFVEFTSYLCTDCGLLWSRVDPNVAKQHLRVYGTEPLKTRLRLQEPDA